MFRALKRPRIRPLTRRRRPAARRRGTVIILVVAILALLVILGAAYLRSASSNSRAASIRDDRPADTAVDDAIAMIRQAMRRDLFGNDGVLLNANDNDDGAGTLDENFDYPHNEVDAWLASNNPADIDVNDDGVIADDEYRWPHLTWLGEPFLAGGGATEAERVKLFVVEENADETDPFVVDSEPDRTDMAKGDFADADGDGIADSRWFTLPSQPVSDRRYIAAVRVVDLSGMVNANIATTLLDENENYDSMSPSRATQWRYPVELDIGRWAVDFGAPIGEVESLLNRRFGITPSDPLLPIDRAQRAAYWTDGWAKAFPGDSGDDDQLRMQSVATLENELELRRLHWPRNADRDVPIERRMPVATNANRQNMVTSNTIANYSDFKTYFEDEPRHRMTVLSAAAPYYLRETTNGGAIADDPVQPLRPDFNLMREDDEVNEMVAEVERVLEANNAFTLPVAFDVDNGLGDPQKRNAYARQIVANLIDYVDVEGEDESGAVVDVKLTAIEGSTPPEATRYGLEALPFITEVYRQRVYKAEQWEQDDPDVNGDGNTTTDWYLVLEQDGDTGYAIELRNPFNREIPLAGITLAIGGNDTDDDGDDVVDNVGEADVEGVALSDHATTLGSDEALIIYHNHANDDADQNTNIYDPAAPVDDRVADGVTVVAGAAGAMAPFEGDEDVTVELRVGATDGETVAYQRAISKKLDDSETEHFVLDGPETAEPPDKDPPEYRYKFVSNVGSADGINMLTIESGDFGDEVAYLPDPAVTDPGPPTTNGSVPPAESGPGSFPDADAEIDQLGETAADKDGVDGDVTDSGSSQIIIPEGTGRLERPADIAMLTILGPRAEDSGPPPVSGATIAEAWDDPDDPDDADGADDDASVTDHMLDFESEDFVGPGDPGDPNDTDHALPHAVLLMDRFASRRYDRDRDPDTDDPIDTDGDGEANEADEAMIPGRINLNTVDQRTLASVLPMPPAEAAQLAEQIIAYRDHLDASSYSPQGADYSVDRGTGLGITGWRDRPGIATIGELVPATSFLLGNDTDGSNTPIDNKQWDGVGADFRIDFTPETDQKDGIANDREEATMLPRWLSQVATTRSDRFAAYIVVRGYDRGRARDDGDSGWEQKYLVERKRVIVLFDRSPALSGEQRIRVLARSEW